jgi:hypothetical protein
MIRRALIGAIAGATAKPSGAFNEATAVLRVDTFVAPGTWSRPALGAFWGVSATPAANRIKAEGWGPGGGGSTNVGGGGGGAYSALDNFDASAKASWDWTGITGAAANTSGTDTTFGGGVLVAKAGQSGAAGGAGGAASAGTGDTKRDGGAGALGTANRAGGGGSGSAVAGSGAQGGIPDGGSCTANVAGRLIGGGGGSGTSTEHAGARGAGRCIYQVTAPAGFARLRSFALTRSAGTVGNMVCNQPTVLTSNVLILLVGSDVDTSLTVAGWASLGSAVNSTFIKGEVFWKAATGSDTADIVAGASTRLNAAILRFAGAGTPTAAFANGSSANADPPSHGTGGAAANGVWIAAAMIDASAVIGIDAPPANYGTWINQGPSGNTGLYMSFALRELNAATENPGAFTSGSEQWVAATVYVPPL